MSKGKRLTEDKLDCPLCGNLEMADMVEKLLRRNTWSVTLICQQCRTPITYNYTTNGFITRRIRQ